MSMWSSFLRAISKLLSSFMSLGRLKIIATVAKSKNEASLLVLCMRVMRRRRARHALTQLIGNRLEDRDLAHSGCLAECALRNHRGVMPLTHCNFSFDLMQL